MIMYPLARTTPLIRQEIVDLVEAGEPIAAVARRFRISRTTVYKWLRRFDDGDGLEDQRSIAASFPTRVIRSTERKIEQLRCRRVLHFLFRLMVSATCLKCHSSYFVRDRRELHICQIASALDGFTLVWCETTY